MASYLITWVIDLDADNPEAAAREALRMILDSHDGGCHIFVTQDKSTGERHSVDLGTGEWRDEGEPMIVRLDPAA